MILRSTKLSSTAKTCGFSSPSHPINIGAAEEEEAEAEAVTILKSLKTHKPYTIYMSKQVKGNQEKINLFTDISSSF